MKIQNKFILILLFTSSLLIAPLYSQTTESDEGAAITATASQGKPIVIGDLSFIKKIPLPSGVTNFLKKVSIVKPTITKNVPVKRDPESATSPTDFGTIITGQATIATVTVDVKVRIVNLQGGGQKLSVIVGLGQGFKLSQIDSKLKALDVLQLTKAAFIFSKDDSNEGYWDPDWNIRVKPGFTLVAGVKVGGEIEKLLRAIGKDMTEIIVQGTINPQISGSFLSITLPGKISLGKVGETTGLVLTLAITEATPGVPTLDIAIKTGLSIKIPTQTAPLLFFGEIRAKTAPPKLYITGWMQGFYENAFGLNGLRIGQFGVRADMDLAAATASGGLLALSGFCLQGAIGFGEKTLSVLGCIDFSTSPDLMLVSSLEGGLYLSDIVAFAADIIKRVTKKDISGIAKDLPHIGFKTFKVYIVPKDTFFGDKIYKKGIEVEVVADILKTDVGLAVRVDEEGINALGYIQAFKIGPLSITGAGPDRKAGTADDGAVVQIQVDPKKLLASLFIDATVELDIFDGIKSGTTINLSTKGLSFQVSVDIFKEFSATVRISAIGAVSPSAAAAASQKAASDSLKSAADALKAGTTAPATGDLSQDTSYGVYVKLTQTALEKWGKACTESAKQMLIDANKEIDKREKEVESLNNQIADLDKKIADIDKKDAAFDTENKANITKAQQQISGLNATKTKLDAAVARCKGKVPSKANDIDEFVAGPQLTPNAIEAQIKQMKAANPTLSDAALDIVRRSLAASIGRDFNNPQMQALYYIEAVPVARDLTKYTPVNLFALGTIVSQYPTISQDVLNQMRLILKLPAPPMGSVPNLSQINATRAQQGLPALQ